MSFEYNVVTSAGAALIAAATSSNQIVFVECLSSTSAASSLADLASKTQSFYDGKEGSIFAASSTGNVARIIMDFSNDGLAQDQVIKSACVIAKLANQADSDAVIMAAVSDSDSAITLPTEPIIHIHIPINITIDADNQVETVGAQYAALSDLARFVSMHKAGDPTTGESQTILGDKTFSGKIIAGNVVTAAEKARITISDTSVFDSPVCECVVADGSNVTYIQATKNKLGIQLANSNGYAGFTMQSTSSYLYITPLATGSIYIGSSDYKIRDIYLQNLHTATIEASGNCNFSGYVGFDGNVSFADSVIFYDDVEIGDNLHVSDNLTVDGSINGTCEKATKDAGGNTITSTYLNAIGTYSDGIRATKPNGATQSINICDLIANILFGETTNQNGALRMFLYTNSTTETKAIGSIVTATSNALSPVSFRSSVAINSITSLADFGLEIGTALNDGSKWKIITPLNVSIANGGCIILAVNVTP